MANMTHRVINSVLLSGETTLLMNDKKQIRKASLGKEIMKCEIF